MKKYLLPLIFILCLVFTLTGVTANLFSTYDKRIKLTIDHTKIDSDLTHFPITLFMTSTQMEEIFAEFDADEDFDRCAITTSDESTQIYGDCELFDNSESKGIYHVAKTGVVTDADADGYLYFYYDKDADHNTTYISMSGGTAAQSIWDGNFKAVYHMRDGVSTSAIYDATSNNNDGTKKAANEPVEIAGKVGQGQDFDGVDDGIEIPENDSLTPPNFSISYWIKPNNLGTGAQPILAKRNVDNVGGYAFVGRDSATVRHHTYIGGGWHNVELVYTNGTWQYIVITYDGETLKGYKDAGSPSTTSISGVLNNDSAVLGIGKEIEYLQTDAFKGVIDEICISGTALTAAWIKASYNAGMDTLLAYGDEEAEAVGITWNGQIITKWNGQVIKKLNTQ